MLAGAVTAFAITVTTGSAALGILTGALAGALMALVFGVLTLSLTREPGRDRPGAHDLRHRPVGAGRLGLRRHPGRPAAAPRDPGPERPAGDRPAAVRPRPAGLPLGRRDGRRRLVPQAHARRHDPARGRRIRRLGALDRLRRDQGALSRGAVRRRHGRPRRRLPVALLHADVGRGDDRGARLDRAGAGGVRLLAALARCCSAPICSAASPSCSSTPRAPAASACRPR